MNVIISIPDSDLPAWNYALDNYNAAAITPLTLEQYVNDIIVGAQTNVNVAAYNQAQMENLVPLGKQYLAAPANVQALVDKELAPYAE